MANDHHQHAINAHNRRIWWYQLYYRVMLCILVIAAGAIGAGINGVLRSLELAPSAAAPMVAQVLWWGAAVAIAVGIVLAHIFWRCV